MKPGTIEVKIAFKGEDRKAINKSIDEALDKHGYEPVIGVKSNVPGEMDLVYVKVNVSAGDLLDPAPEAKKEGKIKKPRKPRAKKVK